MTMAFLKYLAVSILYYFSLSLCFHVHTAQATDYPPCLNQFILTDTIPLNDSLQAPLAETDQNSDSLKVKMGTVAFIQFAAFGSEEKAAELEGQLIDRYPGVYVLKEFSPQLEIDLYKVLIGPLDENAQQNIIKRLNADGIQHWIKPLDRL